jgi:hypothetical protein
MPGRRPRRAGTPRPHEPSPGRAPEHADRAPGRGPRAQGVGGRGEGRRAGSLWGTRTTRTDGAEGQGRLRAARAAWKREIYEPRGGEKRTCVVEVRGDEQGATWALTGGPHQGRRRLGNRLARTHAEGAGVLLRGGWVVRQPPDPRRGGPRGGGGGGGWGKRPQLGRVPGGVFSYFLIFIFSILTLASY